MKIRFLQSIAGANWHAAPGDVMECPAGESAERFIAAGIAAPVPEPVQAATTKAPETATAPAAKAK